jgi:RNA polymerase sigma-70 factor (ECF subfamily)
MMTPAPGHMVIDEQVLLEAARNGDTEAFGVIVKKYMPKALAYARQMTGSAEDAQDLAQEAFIRAYKGLGSFKGDSAFYTWFVRVLSNVCLDHLRKASFYRKVFFFAAKSDEEDDEPDQVGQARDTSPGSRPDEGLMRKELSAELNRALMKLPGRQRAVFLLKHNEDMKLSEIAIALGISEGAVKSHLVRAVAALRKSMKGYGRHG